MKNPLNNSGKIFRWYIWVPYSAAFVCTNTEQQYHQCETNTIDTWTQIQSISRYNDHGVRGTIGLSIFLGDQEPQPPVKSGHSSICLYTQQKKLRKSQKTMQHKNTKANNYLIFICLFRYMSSVEKHVYFKLLAPIPLF